MELSVWGGMELHILIVVPIPLAIHSILCSLTSGAIDDLWASGIHNQDNDDQSSEPFNCSPPPCGLHTQFAGSQREQGFVFSSNLSRPSPYLRLIYLCQILFGIQDLVPPLLL
jgi:hypothetical protein